MKFAKTLTASVAIAASVLLTACHDNPLDKHSKEENAKAFKAAAESAENRLGIQQRSKGLSYRLCMDDLNPNYNCQSFLKKMLSELQKQPGYGSLTEKEFTSSSTWKNVQEEYKYLLFTSLD